MWQESPGASVLPWQSWKPPKSPPAPPAIETTTGRRADVRHRHLLVGRGVSHLHLPELEARRRDEELGPDAVALEVERERLAVDRARGRSSVRPGGRRRELVGDVAGVADGERLALAVLEAAEVAAAPPAIETTTGATPMFVTATCWSADVWPTGTSPKSSRVGADPEPRVDARAAEGERERLAVDRPGGRAGVGPGRGRRELVGDVAGVAGLERVALAVLEAAEVAAGAAGHRDDVWRRADVRHRHLLVRRRLRRPAPGRTRTASARRGTSISESCRSRSPSR